MTFSIGNRKLRVDAAILMLPLLAHRFGMDRETIVLMLSLAAHESGHLIAAKLVHARVSEIRLTPFGALATIERMHDLSPARLIAVAAAGPIANLAAVLVLCALCQMRWIHPMNAAIGLRINLLLLLFNLLPALPLDGGRIAWALLANRFSRAKALRFLTASGITAAAGLITIALNGWIRLGTLNLSLVFAAVFMLASLAKERDLLANSAAYAVLNRIKPLAAPMPAQIYLIDASTKKTALLRTLRTDRAALFLVRENGQIKRMIDDRAILSQLEKQE